LSVILGGPIALLRDRSRPLTLPLDLDRVMMMIEAKPARRPYQRCADISGEFRLGDKIERIAAYSAVVFVPPAAPRAGQVDHQRIAHLAGE
jgi:hypothetical protein